MSEEKKTAASGERITSITIGDKTIDIEPAHDVISGCRKIEDPTRINLDDVIFNIIERVSEEIYGNSCEVHTQKELVKAIIKSFLEKQIYEKWGIKCND